MIDYCKQDWYGELIDSTFEKNLLVKVFILAVAMICMGTGRGYISFNADKFSRHMSELLEVDRIRDLGVRYKKNRLD